MTEKVTKVDVTPPTKIDVTPPIKIDVTPPTEQEAEQLHEDLQPQGAPTPRGSRNLGAKEEQVNHEQTSLEKDSDAPGG